MIVLLPVAVLYVLCTVAVLIHWHLWQWQQLHYVHAGCCMSHTHHWHLLNQMLFQDCEFSVRVSFLELYNEEIFDLLTSPEDTTKLRLYEDSMRKVCMLCCACLFLAAFLDVCLCLTCFHAGFGDHPRPGGSACPQQGWGVCNHDKRSGEETDGCHFDECPLKVCWSFGQHIFCPPPFQVLCYLLLSARNPVRYLFAFPCSFMLNGGVLWKSLN